MMRMQLINRCRRLAKDNFKSKENENEKGQSPECPEANFAAISPVSLHDFADGTGLYACKQGNF